jgi:hypothetical protein
MSKVITIVDIIKDSTSDDKYYVPAINSRGERVTIDITDIILNLSNIILEHNEELPNE